MSRKMMVSCKMTSRKICETKRVFSTPMQSGKNL